MSVNCTFLQFMSTMSAAAQSSANQVISEGNSRQKDIRSSNITAAKAVSDAVRTSLGPKGMDKMVINSKGDVVVSNDGATILKQIEVVHPASKMLVELSTSQDIEAGDGTTSVTIIAGALLGQAQILLNRGYHPQIIAEGFHRASVLAVEALKKISMPLSLENRDLLIKSAKTSLNSKIVSQYSNTLAPLAVDAALRVVTVIDGRENIDLNDIKIIKKVGGTIDDTELVEGLVFDRGSSHAAGGPTRIENAKIGLIQFQLSAPKTNMENQITINQYEQIDRILREERKIILEMCKKIKSTGCNVLLIQKSILRDAVNTLSLQYLSKLNILVVENVERADVEFISKTIGAIPIASIEAFTSAKLGSAALVEEVNTSGGTLVKVTGVNNAGKTLSVLIRGANKLIVDEAERSLHDAFCVIRSLVRLQYLTVGGGAPEVEVALSLQRQASLLEDADSHCIRAFAEAMETIPYTLAENAGLNPISIVTELRSRHAQGHVTDGINFRKGSIGDMYAENVIQPLMVTTSAIKLAAETSCMILKLDDMIQVR